MNKGIGAVRAENECLMGGCGFFRGYDFCERCGFNKYENLRRKRLPLVMGEDGLRRKYVGKCQGGDDGTR